jgi:ribosomal protein S6
MKEYELTVLIHPDLEVDLEAPLAKVRDIITGAGGKITKEDNWGSRSTAQDQQHIEHHRRSTPLPARKARRKGTQSTRRSKS